jgi:agmatinase
VHIFSFFLSSLKSFDPSSSFSQHGAIRTTLSGPDDYDNDDNIGFKRIEAREIDTLGKYFRSLISSAFTELMPLGTDGIIKKIRETVGDSPVYLSIDVRVIELSSSLC